MTVVLTGHGSFAKAYTDHFTSSVASIRELGDTAFVQKLRTAKVIIHNAATIEGNDLELSTSRNFDFTRFIVEKLRELNPTAHLVLLSSMSILNPADDTAYDDVLAMTPYAYSKYLAETFCLKSPLDRVSCVRFSTLFMRDPKKDGLSKLISEAARSGKITIYNHGDARRNFLPLNIAAQYVNKLSEQSASHKGTYTFASPISTSFAEVTNTLRSLLPTLTVNDIEVDSGTPVLSEFSIKSLQEIGEITFTLADEIAAYLREIQT